MAAQLWVSSATPGTGSTHLSTRQIWRLPVDAARVPIASKIAEAKVMRAFFYYLLIDDFGSMCLSIPITISTVDKIAAGQSRRYVYNFIVSELTENVDLSYQKPRAS
jgi:hypothetical protein